MLLNWGASIDSLGLQIHLVADFYTAVGGTAVKDILKWCKIQIKAGVHKLTSCDHINNAPNAFSKWMNSRQHIIEL